MFSMFSSICPILNLYNDGISCNGMQNPALTTKSPHLHTKSTIYLHACEENLHSPGTKESLPAQLDVGDVLQAEQEAPTNVNVVVGDIVAMPVLVEPQQFSQVASVHCPAAV